jgi:hypothetical protein
MHLPFPLAIESVGCQGEHTELEVPPNREMPQTVRMGPEADPMIPC